MKSVISPKKHLEYRLKKRLAPLRKSIVYLAVERKNGLKLPLRTRWRAWRLGFTSASYALYDLDHNDPVHYLRDFSDIDYVMENPESAAINNKFVFSRLIDGLGLRTPEVIAVIRRGAVAWPANTGKMSGDGLPSALLRMLENNERLVLRPVYGGAGGGVLILGQRDGGVQVNGEASSAEDVSRYLRNQTSYIVTPYIQQAAYAEDIYPGALNTLRMLTIWDSGRNQPVLVRAVHRFGSSRSYPMDHYHAGFGGVCAPVDLESGELGAALSLAKDFRITRFDRHPETGGQITGAAIPHWDDAVESVLEAARNVPTSPYVGWDVAITEQGPSFIEANNPSGPAILQVHAPLLEDERIRRFYRELGMI